VEDRQETDVRAVDDDNQFCSRHGDGLPRDRRRVANKYYGDDQRPWVGIGSIQVIPGATNQQEIYLIVGIINTGKSPALDVAITSAEWNSNIDTVDFPIKRCEGDCRVENHEIVPSAFTVIHIPKVNQIPVPSIGDKLNVIIRVDYRDSHNNRYYTGICQSVTTSLDPRSNRSVIVDQASCTKPNSNGAT
jgi:hypothetical protein